MIIDANVNMDDFVNSLTYDTLMDRIEGMARMSNYGGVGIKRDKFREMIEGVEDQKQMMIFLRALIEGVYAIGCNTNDDDEE